MPALDNRINEKVGRRIPTLRRAMEWTQEKLAEKAGLHVTYIGGIERGERNVSLKNLDRIAQAFHLTLPQFFRFCDGRGGRCP